MPLGFVRPLAIGWELQQAASAGTLCMPLSLQ